MGFALAENHIKSLDDEVGVYIEEWRGSPEGKITLRQFLTNSSGLELPNEFEVATDPSNKYAQVVDGSNSNAAALAYKLADKPGESFMFNHVNSHLLGIVIQRATDRRYTEYLSVKFWRPIGAQRGAMRIDRIDGKPPVTSSLGMNQSLPRSIPARFVKRKRRQKWKSSSSTSSTQSRFSSGS